MCLEAYVISFLSVYLPINFWIPEPIVMKLGIYIMVPEPVWTVYFIHASHQSVCLYVYVTNTVKIINWTL
jgi:hypothetical protein